MSSDHFALNPQIDLGRLSTFYALKQRLQVRDFLRAQDAEALLAILERETPWGLAFNDGERVVCLGAEQRRRLSVVEQQRISASVLEGARRGYQFIYSIYPLLEAYFDRAAPHSPLFPLFEWLNSAEFLDFARKLTGLSNIVWADGQATMFSAGHFLKYHTDETPSQKRLAAYVINLTRGWGRDWGGFLQFFDEKYDIEEGLRPVFNAINIFTVPAHHSVSMVANYAPRGRLAITGWLRGDDRPSGIGSRG
jgi:SM-20-related protein